ncbi:RHS repeat-associated protein, partial [Flavobacterium croceum DSM 17960]
NNYYPFGMKHEKYNVEESVFISGNRGSFGYYKGAGNSTSSVTYKYKYNGKELQDELGLLNLYDYGARNYDPAIGRWMNMDGFSEKYFPLSPYTYAVNNPMFFVDPDGNYIEIYYGQDGKSHYTYNYVKNRNYSEIKDPFLADAYKALDALYKASNIEIDGKEINVIQTLMDDTRELSVVETTSDELQSTFAKDRDYISKGMWNARGEEGKILGTVHFNTSQAIRYDDINDTNNVKDFYDKNGKLKSTVKTNSPTALLGHEFVHAFNWSQNKTDYINRVRDTSTRNQTPWFKNAEEARTTTLSSQININLGEPSRSNYHAEGIKVPNVLSNKPSN